MNLFSKIIRKIVGIVGFIALGALIGAVFYLLIAAWFGWC